MVYPSEVSYIKIELLFVLLVFPGHSAFFLKQSLILSLYRWNRYKMYFNSDLTMSANDSTIQRLHKAIQQILLLRLNHTEIACLKTLTLFRHGEVDSIAYARPTVSSGGYKLLSL